MKGDGQDGRRRWVVAQLGARMAYAVPRILHEAGLLAGLHTDVYAGGRWVRPVERAVSLLLPEELRPAALRRLEGRRAQGVPPVLVRAYAGLGIRYALRLRRARSPGAIAETYLWAGREFCRRVVERGLDGIDGVYTFNSAALEILERVRGTGAVGVLEQTTAPKAAEVAILAEERRRFPELEDTSSHDGTWQRYAARERAEWELADLVLCGSQFVADSIRMVGGPGEKAIVVPYGVEPPHSPRARQPHTGEGLKVLFVGYVGLRKGAHYLIEAARLLRGEGVRVRLVGPVGMNLRAMGPLPPNVEIVGAVPRAEVARHYEWADVFCLPSLCEGSATVTYEALAAGLPVITTPNAGSIVRDGVDGFIVPVRDARALADAIERSAARDWPAPGKGRADGEPPPWSYAAYARRLLSVLQGAGRVPAGA